MKNFYKKGFSIAEILIIVAVLGIIFAIVIPQFTKTRELQVLKNGTEEIVTSIDKARVETLSSLNSSSYGVHFQSDKIVIFKGTSYSAGDVNNETISITTPASITNVTFGGVSSVSGDMYFARLSGAPSTTGTVTVATSSYSKTITISATGNASSN